MEIALQERQSYYRAGALGLRALQDRGLGTQRFSADAEARWKAFRGELADADRLDLLLRDAAVLHPLAFSAAAVFGLPDLAVDEPFGPEWSSLSAAQAGGVLREVSQNPVVAPDARPSQILGVVAKEWGLALGPADASGVVAASRVVVAGAGAVAALADHMMGRAEMDFGDQLLLVSDRPAERQLFGLAAALCGSRARPRTVRSNDSLDAVKATKFERATTLVLSPDADGTAAEAAKRIADALAG